jgi:manganese/iron transport system ATP-binding protein
MTITRTEASDNPVVELRQASLGYQSEPVLTGVDLQIHAGDFVGLAGANGSGKTTLLKSMLGILPLLGGTVERNFALANLGYVPQTSSLDSYFPLSVDEVVAMGAYGRVNAWTRFPKRERTRVASVLAHVGLSHLARTSFFHLSGGQQQRVLIARALVVDPVLLLLDEPLAGVDQESRKAIVDLLTLINRQQGLAIVISSHDRQILEQGCQQVILVSDGCAYVTEKGALPGISPVV